MDTQLQNGDRKMKESSLQARIKKELAAIASKSGGVLRPESVVEFAKDPDTALHSRFEWDDGKASHEYRLWQARHLLRVVVRYEERVDRPVHVYVSLPSDRSEDGGGYRRMVDVLSDIDRRAQLLDAALAELAVLERKYALIKELADVFSAARKVREQKRQKVRKRALAMAK